MFHRAQLSDSTSYPSELAIQTIEDTDDESQKRRLEQMSKKEKEGYHVRDQVSDYR
jgi:hypothetical protein